MNKDNGFRDKYSMLLIDLYDELYEASREDLYLMLEELLTDYINHTHYPDNLISELQELIKLLLDRFINEDLYNILRCLSRQETSTNIRQLNIINIIYMVLDKLKERLI